MKQAEDIKKVLYAVLSKSGKVIKYYITWTKNGETYTKHIVTDNVDDTDDKREYIRNKVYGIVRLHSGDVKHGVEVVMTKLEPYIKEYTLVIDKSVIVDTDTIVTAILEEDEVPTPLLEAIDVRLVSTRVLRRNGIPGVKEIDTDDDKENDKENDKGKELNIPKPNDSTVVGLPVCRDKTIEDEDDIDMDTIINGTDIKQEDSNVATNSDTISEDSTGSDESNDQRDTDGIVTG